VELKRNTALDPFTLVVALKASFRVRGAKEDNWLDAARSLELVADVTALRMLTDTPSGWEGEGVIGDIRPVFRALYMNLGHWLLARPGELLE
jgi:hypothetical protein